MRQRQRAETVTAEISIANVSDSSVQLILEPWARVYDVPSEGRMKVTLVGPDKADIEIEVGPAEMTLWGWVGSTLDDHINPPGGPVPQIPGSSYSPQREGWISRMARRLRG
jgi:hypothetical protein